MHLQVAVQPLHRPSTPSRAIASESSKQHSLKLVFSQLCGGVGSPVRGCHSLLQTMSTTVSLCNRGLLQTIGRCAGGAGQAAGGRLRAPAHPAAAGEDAAGHDAQAARSTGRAGRHVASPTTRSDPSHRVHFHQCVVEHSTLQPKRY